MTEIICEGCGYTYPESEFSTVMVELRDGSTIELPLCNKICYPDFWDDTEPGEWVEVRNAFTDGYGREVRCKYWRCENCDGVYEHDFVKLVLDTDYDQPSEAIICLFCHRKEQGRYLEK